MWLLSACAVGLVPPTFPANFYVGQQLFMALNKGGATYSPDGGLCCSKTKSPQCSLQTVSQGQDTWQSASLKMQRFGSVIKNFTANSHKAEEFGREMAVVPAAQMPKYANSSHKWACAAYCPMKSGTFYDLVDIGDGRKVDKVSFVGNVTVVQRQAPGRATKLTSDFHWDTRFLGRTLQHTDMFVDYSTEPPVPFMMKQIAPPQNAGEEDTLRANTSFLQFTPMDTAPYFDVDPQSYDACELAQSCSDDGMGDGGMSGRTDFERYVHIPPLGDLGTLGGQQAAQSAPAKTAFDASTPPHSSAPSGTPPTISADYSANVERYMVSHAGQVSETAEEICCEASALAQCQVMLSHSLGPTYHDFTHQRQRREDSITKRVFVDDLHAHVSMLVNVSGGRDTCQEWCPVNPSDRLDNFTPWEHRKGPLIDAGHTSVRGKPVEHYAWKNGLVLLGVYEQYDLFTTKNASGAATDAPVLLMETVHMLSQVGMQTNTTFDQYLPGTPPATKFEIAKGPAEGCPQSKQCGGATWQMHRLASRQYATHAMFA